MHNIYYQIHKVYEEDLQTGRVHSALAPIELTAINHHLQGLGPPPIWSCVQYCAHFNNKHSSLSLCVCLCGQYLQISHYKTSVVSFVYFINLLSENFRKIADCSRNC